ncbi:MAG: YraN family protein [Acidimicrobiales bacterium mtb01]|nr:YraN family protein [Actinomycetota bacterium]TEX45553.1 MAG: YraN family protein [Acidimicrobiales bacterium mtb01]
MSRRGANNARGRWGEDRAAEWYRARGYLIVARNWRHGRHGEIDLIARRDDVVVVCEVKARANDYFGHPALAVDQRKQSRLRRLAAAWLAEHRPGRVTVRFDVAAVSGARVDVIENAF